MASAKQIAWRKKFARMSKAGKFKKSKKSNPHNTQKPKVYSDLAIELKNKFKGKSDADLRRIIRTKKGNTDDEGYELGRRIAERL